MERRTKIAVILRARGRERRHWKGIIYNGRNSVYKIDPEDIERSKDIIKLLQQNSS